MSSPEADAPVSWWGTFTLATEQVGRWQVGPSTIWVERLVNEWRLSHQQNDDPVDSAVAVELSADPAAIPDGVTVSRFTFAKTGAAITLRPGLADRPVVVRPEKPVYVMSGEEITLYLSTPLWLRFFVGEPEKLLTELPSFRPSDTWFGPSTREGESCYASRTAARVRLEDLPRRPHRAVTPLRLSNRTGDKLLIDRVKVPIRYLTLYRDGGGWHWTQAATLLQEEKGDLAALQLDEGSPPEANACERVAEPREKTERSTVLRVFGRLLSGD